MFRIFEFLDEIIENNIEVDSDVAKNFELFLKNGAERIEKFLFDHSSLFPIVQKLESNIFEVFSFTHVCRPSFIVYAIHHPQ